MRWFKRGLWLAAWSLWAWLGWGLYRELPRELGPVVCALPLGDDLSPLGFIGDTDVVVTKSGRGIISVPDIGRSLECWDARSGKRLGGVDRVQLGRWGNDPPARAIRHGYFIGEAADHAGGGLRKAIWNLQTGDGKSLPAPDSSMLDYHCTLPFAAFTSESRPNRPTSIQFVNLEKNRVIGEWRLGDANPQVPETIDAGYFLDNPDEFLIVLRRTDNETHRLVRCRIDGSAIRGSTTVRGAERSFSRPHGGRIASSRITFESKDVCVHDMRDGQPLWSESTQIDVPEALFWQVLKPAATLSANGRCVLTQGQGLVDVDARRPVWSPQEFLEGESSECEDSNSFWVWEDWKAILARFDLRENLTTWTLRDLNDGRLLVRLLRGPLELNQAGTLAAANDGTIYAWPPRRNYPLLALCQAILALPLVLLWAALRWRRKRRMRLAGVAP